MGDLARDLSSLLDLRANPSNVKRYLSEQITSIFWYNHGYPHKLLVLWRNLGINSNRTEGHFHMCPMVLCMLRTFAHTSIANWQFTY